MQEQDLPELLRLMYEFRTSPPNEKANAKTNWDAAVENAIKGTNFSSQEIWDFLATHHYPEFLRQMRRDERRGI